MSTAIEWQNWVTSFQISDIIASVIEPEAGMFSLVERNSEKEGLQSQLYKQLTNGLPRCDIQDLGNRGGTDRLKVYSNRVIWYAHQIAPTANDAKSGRASKAIKRHWNGFGLLHQIAPTVEINIPIELNTGKVAGFFARANDGGVPFLMHSGRVGGGKPGIGKNEFLRHSGYQLVDVKTENQASRQGIIVSDMTSDSLLTNIQEFVLRVADFRASVAGKLH